MTPIMEPPAIPGETWFSVPLGGGKAKIQVYVLPAQGFITPVIVEEIDKEHADEICLAVNWMRYVRKNP